MPAWVARTELSYGRFLADRGGVAAGGRARELLTGAARRAGELGMVTVAARAEAALEGCIPAPAGERAPGGTPRGRLSDRELAVLRLLAEGRTNREIGGQLFISEHTAANHVRSILTKTGCANRTAAAGWAFRHGLATN